MYIYHMYIYELLYTYRCIQVYLVCPHMHAYTYIHIYVYIHAYCIYIYIYIATRVYTPRRTHTCYGATHLFTRKYTHIHSCIHAYMNTHTYTYIYIHIHVYTYTRYCGNLRQRRDATQGLLLAHGAWRFHRHLLGRMPREVWVHRPGRQAASACAVGLPYTYAHSSMHTCIDKCISLRVNINTHSVSISIPLLMFLSTTVSIPVFTYTYKCGTTWSLCNCLGLCVHLSLPLIYVYLHGHLYSILCLYLQLIFSLISICLRLVILRCMHNFTPVCICIYLCSTYI